MINIIKKWLRKIKNSIFKSKNEKILIEIEKDPLFVEEIEIENIEIEEEINEFPTLNHHKIELEKKIQPKKKKIIKKKKNVNSTHKQHKSKGLTFKLPKTRKIKKNKSN
ncbi:MAG: hypothetical protein AM1032_000376 [Mycoplasmataceae bacterium]|nr:MAG: hypothetical protein AM1032_000376 [Mycoplasmataceae bacterium]